MEFGVWDFPLTLASFSLIQYSNPSGSSEEALSAPHVHHDGVGGWGETEEKKTRTAFLEW